MEMIKDLPFPTISFIVGAIALIIAIARNVSIKEINIRMTLGQSLVLGFIGLILMGIGIYGHFFTPTVPEAMVSNAADTPFETPFATRGTSLQSYLEMNERPATGQELGSPNGRFILSLYIDGNLVLYDSENKAPIWSSNTVGTRAEFLSMQEDGNLVLYAENGDALWASGTASDQSDRFYRFQINDDGNMVILRDGIPIWASNTNY